MPSRSKNRKNKGKRKRQRGRKGSKKYVSSPSRPLGAGGSNGFNSRATFRTFSTITSIVTIPAATASFRVDIIPTLDLFPIDTTATRFMTYRVNRVSYSLIPRFNISSMSGTLPVMYTVPVQSRLLPASLPSDFVSFADCKVSQFARPHRGSFVPLSYLDSAEQTALERSLVL